MQSPNPSGPRPLSERSPPPQNDFHPINTSIPEGRFLDDIDSLNFSKRGSILFGGKRAVSPPNPALGPSPMQMSPTRAAPAPVPAVEAADGAPDSKTAVASLQPTPRDSARKLSLPNIRVMSVDTERESQKRKKKAAKRPSFVPLSHYAAVGHFAAVATRKVIDEAGEMLGLPPGLVDIEEEQKSEQAMKDAHEREVKRTEKWRKMAKTVTKGRDGKGVMFAVEDIAKVKRSKDSEQHFEIQGTVIEFDVKSPKLIERTWKGIPDCWRGAAWYSFLSASAQNAKSDSTEEQLFTEFRRLQDMGSPDDTQIDLDVPRTINKHIMFRKRYRGGQRLLFRVLHAMSLYFPDTGYVQGMAGLAATMLCYYDEERCFVMLVRLWQFRGLERLYQPGFAGLMLALKDLENHWLHGKAAAQKLNEMGIDPTAYGTRWYLTLFNLSIPFAAQLRVWDVFMLLGGSQPLPDPGAAKEKEAEATFNGLEILHATSAALIDGQKELIIDADFENVMKALTSAQPVKDEDRFMNVVRAEWNTHRKKRRS
ncbi:putative tbc domain-containing protein [Diaporthe ampelina]|uniref:Putative tbc domain-containing protein n=1 Tax=Diaporthe ampelina TaxID=1214573 RepID=A0A0G2FVP7_9PEZI|nr:putative tbc domain-containing protein [Diaporthe ampelina]